LPTPPPYRSGYHAKFVRKITCRTLAPSLVRPHLPLRYFQKFFPAPISHLTARFMDIASWRTNRCTNRLGRSGPFVESYMAKPAPSAEAISISSCFAGTYSHKQEHSSPAVLSVSVHADSMRISVEYSGCESTSASPQHRKKTRCTSSPPQSNP
jgi:hypothetical protein